MLGTCKLCRVTSPRHSANRAVRYGVLGMCPLCRVSSMWHSPNLAVRYATTSGHLSGTWQVCLLPGCQHSVKHNFGKCLYPISQQSWMLPCVCGPALGKADSCRVLVLCRVSPLLHSVYCFFAECSTLCTRQRFEHSANIWFPVVPVINFIPSLSNRYSLTKKEKILKFLSVSTCSIIIYLGAEKD